MRKIAEKPLSSSQKLVDATGDTNPRQDRDLRIPFAPFVSQPIVER